MGFYEEKKKVEGSAYPALTAGAVVVVVALISWWLGLSSNLLAVGGVADLAAAAGFITWLVSKRIYDADGTIQYIGATTSSSQIETESGKSSWFQGVSNRTEEFQRVSLSFAVGSSVALCISKLIGGYVIALLVGAAAAVKAEKWIREGGGSDEARRFIRTSISLGVGTAVAWGISKLFGGYVIALTTGAILAWQIAEWLRKLDEKRKKKKWSDGAMFTALAIGAAGVAALAAWGVSKSSRRRW